MARDSGKKAPALLREGDGIPAVSFHRSREAAPDPPGSPGGKPDISPGEAVIVPYADAHAGALSALILRNFRQVNSRDYPPEEIKRLCRRHTPADVRRLMGEGWGLTALLDGVPVGCARVVPVKREPGCCFLSTVFVSPDVHGRGWGRLLLAQAEKTAKSGGGRRMILHASLTAQGFYAHLGYLPAASENGVQGLIPMEKQL